jgi:hypothetical protein
MSEWHAPWLVALLGITLALGACGRTDQAQRPPPPSVSGSPSTAPPTQTAQAGKAAQPEGANSADTGKGSDEPMKSMSKDEETKAMPQPGQANDHSTLAQDPKEPKDSTQK